MRRHYCYFEVFFEFGDPNERLTEQNHLALGYAYGDDSLL